MAEGTPDDLTELAEYIKAGRAVCFVGAGATRDGGGCSWDELAKHVADTLSIKESLTPQKTFDDVCTYKKRRGEAYAAVQKRLSAVRAPSHLSSILSYPWLAVYTTNYDEAIEEHYREQGVRQPNVLNGTERVVQFGIPGEVPIFKLAGTVSKAAGETGEMVLSAIDRKAHQREYGAMYDHLDDLVTGQAVLAVGYSFADEILKGEVEVIRGLRVQSQIKIYALFRPEDNSPLIDDLKALDVIIVRDDMAGIESRLKPLVAGASGEEPLLVRFNGRPLSLRPRSVKDVLYSFDLITETECKQAVGYKDFLRGSTRVQGAYETNLPWQRTAIADARAKVRRWATESGAKRHMILSFVGRPGSGRTVASSDLLHEVVSKFPAAGLRVPQRSPRLDSFAAGQLYEHLIERAPKDPPPFLCVLADEYAAMSDIWSFIYELGSTGARLVIIRPSSSPLRVMESRSSEVQVEEYLLGDKLSSADVGSIAGYISNLPKDLKKRPWTTQEVQLLIEKSGSFIEAMYSLVDPAHRSFKDIIDEDYRRIPEKRRLIVNHLVLPTLAGSEMPLTLLAKILKVDYPTLYGWLEECSTLVRLPEEGAETPAVALYHKQVATIISSIPAYQKSAAELLKQAIGTANLRGGSEHQMIADIMLKRPMSASPADRVLPETTVDALFEFLSQGDASRLLLHHYGLRLRDKKQYKPAVDAIAQSLKVSEDEFRPTDRREIVETSLAQVRWFALRGDFPVADDPRVLQLREDLRDLRAKSRWNPHSYRIEASVLEDLASWTTGNPQLDLLSEALAIVREGLRASGGENADLVEGLKSILEKSSGFTAQNAEDLLMTYGNGHGYYLLFEDTRRKGQQDTSLLLKALAASQPCVPALREAIEIELDGPNPDYEKAKAYSDTVFEAGASRGSAFRLTWADQLQRTVCLLGTKNGGLIFPHLAETKRLAPRNIPQPFPYFLKSNGSRTEYQGIVGDVNSKVSGEIYSHNVPGFSTYGLFFNPSAGKFPTRLTKGERVKFNLAIGVVGLQAWDVTPR